MVIHFQNLYSGIETDSIDKNENKWKRKNENEWKNENEKNGRKMKTNGIETDENISHQLADSPTNSCPKF